MSFDISLSIEKRSLHPSSAVVVLTSDDKVRAGARVNFATIPREELQLDFKCSPLQNGQGYRLCANRLTDDYAILLDDKGWPARLKRGEDYFQGIVLSPLPGAKFEPDTLARFILPTSGHEQR